MEKKHASPGQSNGLPCVEGYQSGNKVKWLDYVEFCACQAQEKLAQPKGHLVEAQNSVGRTWQEIIPWPENNQAVENPS